ETLNTGRQVHRNICEQGKRKGRRKREAQAARNGEPQKQIPSNSARKRQSPRNRATPANTGSFVPWRSALKRNTKNLSPSELRSTSASHGSRKRGSATTESCQSYSRGEGRGANKRAKTKISYSRHPQSDHGGLIQGACSPDKGVQKRR